MFEGVKIRLRRAGRLSLATLGSLLLYLPLTWFAPGSALTAIAQLAVTVCILLWLTRAARAGIRKAIWSLRNRLLVTYLFIAVVPVLLIAALALVGAWTLGSQVALYLATSELDRRVVALRYATESLARAAPRDRMPTMRGMSETFFQRQFPGIVFYSRSPSRFEEWPASVSEFHPPSREWSDASGIVLIGDRPYVWAHAVADDTDCAAVAPLTPRFLGELVPGLLVSLADTGKILDAKPTSPEDSSAGLDLDRGNLNLKRPAGEAASRLPPPANRFDIDVAWFLPTKVASWDSPRRQRVMVLYVRTRPSVLLSILSAQKLGDLNSYLPYILVGVAILFLIVELVALVIGISLTRTITHAVHELYQGTQKVIEGDFSHRIRVHRNDQLGELTTSFNVMTGNVERLLAVAKEKERLQSELEIAREVQSQLYPHRVPEMKTLRLTAYCKPARTVSGDYYDYVAIDAGHIAISIGDVAGKGISAALLMATLQSSIRAQTRSAVQYAASVSADGCPQIVVSTSRLVSDLNRHIHAFTSPEKYATFCFGVYDDTTGVLSYTNAGHLPPVLIRDGSATPLDVNGMVVGAFPFAQYGESHLQLRAGDLLLCYTDGITEPENAYGEMFGDERLIDLVSRNVSSSEEQIVRTVIEAVEQWAGVGEQFDDMTILLARRC